MIAQALMLRKTFQPKKVCNWEKRKSIFTYHRVRWHGRSWVLSVVSAVRFSATTRTYLCHNSNSNQNSNIRRENPHLFSAQAFNGRWILSVKCNQVLLVINSRGFKSQLSLPSDDSGHIPCLCYQAVWFAPVYTQTNHRLCGSAALLSGWPVVSMGEPKLWPPYFQNPSIFPYQNLHRWLRPPYLRMCKIWLKSVYGGLPHE